MTPRLLVDTGVASFIFKWHPEFAPRYIGIISDFKILHSDSLLCSEWAAVRNESKRKGRKTGSSDAWIAASALVLSVPLVTNNAKDYRHLEHLQLLSASAQ